MDEQSCTIPQEIGGWLIEMTWTVDDTQAGPSMLTIQPKDPENVPAGGLSSTVLRAVDFRAGAAELHEKAVKGLVEWATNDFMDWVRESQAKGPKPMDLVREALSEGITDEYLSLLAMQYLGRVTTGQEKPVNRIAEELGKSLGTVKGHLWQARKRGLLVGGSAGRKGGQISEEARRLAMDWSMKRYPPKMTT